MSPKRVRYQVKYAVEKLPVLVKAGELYIVWNGHHRAVANLALEKQTLRARVFHPSPEVLSAVKL